ncbi:polymorphic toxin-type HINT domain-containing protein [Actinoplanes oblitus]|uniref:Polymorphic toxin-type HINT domain-containing protein n=1 Tax=Actinoplanes oblitus TaxID=3040509 RepID=A0ABY8WTW8_9ACTN|nr:polymorphic toxin-type HINT domain-containing protein [Actinoplanes oblitus]WIN00109.1 polymorphic toxin-type HINT domain-containing protein [Actinoplanes oblitus]
MGTKPQQSSDCVSNSFVAGTPVLMADGTTKPIEQIKPGDQVMAGSVDTNQPTPERVSATIVGAGDKNLIDIDVEATDGTQATVTATDGHPFWVDNDGSPRTPGGDWINAAELRQGQWLKTSTGTLVRVAGTHAYTQHTQVYNLTVDDLHTYYVLAGKTAALVHNCGFSDRAREIWDAEPDQFIKDRVSTVAVIRAQTPLGPVDLIAGSGDGLTPAQMSVPLKAGEMYVPNIPGTDAEQNIFLYMRVHGYELIAGGTSRNVCRNKCLPWIREFGGAMQGEVYPGNGKKTTRQRSFVKVNLGD